MSGFLRLLASLVTGPRELKLAMVSPLSVAATVKEASYMAGGSTMVEQDGPLLLAAATTTIPAARTLSTTVCSVKVEQPSLGGQVHELLITSGALAGSPCEGTPPIG